MTYLILGNNQENIKEEVKKLISLLWEKDFDIDNSINNPDIHILKSQNIKSVGIQDVKDLQKEMIFSPYKEKVQIALIPQAEKLTVEAQNSLLKVLEEGGESTAYILTTNSEKSILPTVISRSMKIYCKEGTEKGVEYSYHKVLEKNMLEAFDEIEKISKDKEKVEEFLRALELYYQDILKQDIKKHNDTRSVSESIKEILKTRQRIAANGNKRLLLENLFLVLTI